MPHWDRAKSSPMLHAPSQWSDVWQCDSCIRPKYAQLWQYGHNFARLFAIDFRCWIGKRAIASGSRHSPSVGVCVIVDWTQRGEGVLFKHSKGTFFISSYDCLMQYKHYILLEVIDIRVTLTCLEHDMTLWKCNDIQRCLGLQYDFIRVIRFLAFLTPKQHQLYVTKTVMHWTPNENSVNIKKVLFFMMHV